MSKGSDYTGSIRGNTNRPFNCGTSLGTKERCPRCGQFHLRPGYCQALDPQKSAIDAGKDAWIKKRAAELRAFYARIDSISDDDETFHSDHETFHDAETFHDETDNLRSCDECGEGFETARKDSRYCSSACRLKAHRRKKDVS